jgi:hypothetical protein
MAPPLFPLLVPLGSCYASLRKEKHRLSAALAVLGRKAGELLGMTPLEEAMRHPERKGHPRLGRARRTAG